MRTICSAQRTIHIDYQHPRDKKDNEQRIARASQAEWVELVLPTDGSERAEESSGIVSAGV